MFSKERIFEDTKDYVLPFESGQKIGETLNQVYLDQRRLRWCTESFSTNLLTHLS